MKIEVETKFNLGDIVRMIGWDRAPLRGWTFFDDTRPTAAKCVLRIFHAMAHKGMEGVVIVEYWVRPLHDGGNFGSTTRVWEDEIEPAPPLPERKAEEAKDCRG